MMAPLINLTPQVRDVSMVKVRDVIDAVKLAGWLYDHTTGDHRVYKRDGVDGIVVIAGKLGADTREACGRQIREAIAVYLDALHRDMQERPTLYERRVDPTA